MLEGGGFDLAVAGVSFLAGVLGAMIGLGGGILITPLLVLGFGIDIRYAMGAALCSVIATSGGAAAAYLRDGISNMRIGMFLCIATTVGAVCGAAAAMVLDAKALSVIFGVALLVTAGLSLRGKKEDVVAPEDSDPWATRLGLNGEAPLDGRVVRYGMRRLWPGFFVMWIAGVLSGLLGIGSGAFKVLAMDQIMRLPFKVTTATSNFMIGVTAAASVGIYLKEGYLDPVLVAPVSLGVLAGAFLGAKLLPYAPVAVLRAVFLVAVSAIAVQMVARGLGVSIG